MPGTTAHSLGESRKADHFFSNYFPFHNTNTNRIRCSKIMFWQQRTVSLISQHQRHTIQYNVNPTTTCFRHWYICIITSFSVSLKNNIQICLMWIWPLLSRFWGVLMPEQNRSFWILISKFSEEKTWELCIDPPQIRARTHNCSPSTAGPRVRLPADIKVILLLDSLS